MVVLSCDGKGIVIRPDWLRPATEKATAAAKAKLDHRLSARSDTANAWPRWAPSMTSPPSLAVPPTSSAPTARRPRPRCEALPVDRTRMLLGRYMHTAGCREYLSAASTLPEGYRSGSSFCSSLPK